MTTRRNFLAGIASAAACPAALAAPTAPRVAFAANPITTFDASAKFKAPNGGIWRLTILHPDGTTSEHTLDTDSYRFFEIDGAGGFTPKSRP